MVAEISPPKLLGECYTLDTAGACAGPLFAIFLMWVFSDNYRLVFWIAVIPAFLAMFLLISAVKEPPEIQISRPARFPVNRHDLARLGKPYWQITGVTTVATMARFSEAFLMLKASETGLKAGFIPVVFVIMNFVYALSSHPAGKLSDKINRKYLLLAGFVILM